jgi:hypothetical protein
MVSVQIKFIDEGLSPNTDEIKEFAAAQFAEDNIAVTEDADLTLKIKFTIDNDQELVLIQLRETNTKLKLGEKVIHYLPESCKNDITHESHALVAGLVTAES